MRKQKMDHWIATNRNVLFCGRHGVGKTACIIEAFDRNKLNWKYFSASTMDPWVDFIGCPKEKVEDGKSYLELIRPKEFQNDEIEAIFFDEYNRSHKKVRNAVMELIQFKSINGRKFENLRFIWAAINPEDEDEYDVEALDPAQKDRFHVYVEVPYKPDLVYFKNKYGEKLSRGSLAWWKELPQEIKNQVSPRRLDYALEEFSNNGDIRDILPKSANISKLIECLHEGPITDRIKDMQEAGDLEKAKTFISVENNYASAIKHIVGDLSRMQFWLPLISEEKLVAILADKELNKKDVVLDCVIDNMSVEKMFSETIGVISSGNGPSARNSSGLRNKVIEKVASRWGKSGTPTKAFFRKSKTVGRAATPDEFDKLIKNCVNGIQHSQANTISRRGLYNDVYYAIPAVVHEETAIELLTFLEQMAKRTQFSGFQQLPNVLGVLNHTIACSGLSWKLIVQRGLISEVLRKLQNQSSKVLRPMASIKSTTIVENQKPASLPSTEDHLQRRAEANREIAEIVQKLAAARPGYVPRTGDPPF
jgi:hypothetical protein